MVIMMLLFVVLLASGIVSDSLAHGTRTPSAHLEGRDAWAVFYVSNQVLRAWDPYHSKSHVMGGFQFINGHLRVPMDGRYYVYAQLYFNSTPKATSNRVAVYANNRLILMIQKDLRPGVEETGFTGGVFKLREGEMIKVKVIGDEPTKMWLGPNHSYFGAYMI